MPTFPATGGSNVWVNPLGPPLSTVVRYVAPGGSDANDGKSWNTAKQTILAAYDDLPGGNTQGLINIEDGSYVGGEVTGQGIWIYAVGGPAPAGWRVAKLCTFQGYGGPQGQFTANGATILRGRPGDDQTWDLTKPTIWVANSLNNLFFNNLGPGGASGFGFTRLGVDWNGDRAATVSNVRMNGCTFASKLVTSANLTQTGPAYDMGWCNLVYFNGCAAYGGYQTADPNDVNLNSDYAAGWLVKPNDAVAGSPGSIGYVSITNCTAVLTGIKYYVGATGFGLTVDNYLVENGPSPHPISLNMMPGATSGGVQVIQGQLDHRNVAVADGAGFGDGITVYIDPTIPNLNVNQISGVTLAGVSNGPYEMFGQNPSYYNLVQDTNWHRKQIGFGFGGHINGITDAGRRLGAPAAVPYANKTSSNPHTWTVVAAPTLTFEQPDPFGGTNGVKMTGTFHTDALLAYDGTIGGHAITLATGDMVCFGVWVRGPAGTGLDTPVYEISNLSGSFSDYWPSASAAGTVSPRGNGEWRWISSVGVYQQPGGSPVSEQLKFQLNCGGLGSHTFAFPLMYVLPAASGWSATEAWEMMANAATWNPNVPAGNVAALRGQAIYAPNGFVAGDNTSDGLGQVQFFDGANVGTAPANTARLRYNSSTNKIQYSKNTGAWTDLV